MVDVFDAQKRSEVMSRIRSSGNKETELAMLRILRENKISGWRRNLPRVGKPVSVHEERLVLFVVRCFAWLPKLLQAASFKAEVLGC